MSNIKNIDFSKNKVRLDISRTTIDIPHTFKTTANAGDLNICYCAEVLPGDTFDMKSAVVARMATPIHPVMDNCYIDMEYFFVPNRLVWEHWEEFLGVNKDSFWAQTTTYSIPQITAPTGGWQKGSLAEQIGIPIGIAGISVSALPFRAYGLIYNYFWRNKNLVTPIGVNIDDTTRTGSNGTNYITDCQLGGMPAKAMKLNTLFTRALPSPQKGPAVSLPLGTTAPVFTGPESAIGSASTNAVLRFRSQEVNFGSPGTASYPSFFNHVANADSIMLKADTGASESLSGGPYASLFPSNLYADLRNATASTVNQLRLSFATQRILEAQARAGCSYQELLNGLFSVNAGDSRLQMPEFLGGKRINVNMSQVLQTSSTDSTSPQGNTAAYSLTAERDIGFKKSFVEHGYVIGVYTIRNEVSYQQGIPKHLLKKSKYDFYWPQLANIGEVGIKNAEIYAQGSSVDDQIFGYQEAWYEYRYHPNMIGGEFRSQYAQSLDSWHYGEDFSSLPTLGSSFVFASKNNINRTLAVQNHDQFLVSFAFHNKATRPMPLYSIPGLIDHH